MKESLSPPCADSLTMKRLTSGILISAYWKKKCLQSSNAIRDVVSILPGLYGFFLNDRKKDKAEEKQIPYFSVCNYMLLTLRFWDAPDIVFNCRIKSNIIQNYCPDFSSLLTILCNILCVNQCKIRCIFSIKLSILYNIKYINNKNYQKVISLSINITKKYQQKKKYNACYMICYRPIKTPNLSMDKKISDAISGQCSSKQHKGMIVAATGKLNTTELPETPKEAQAISRVLQTKLHSLLQSQVLRRSSPLRYGRLWASSLQARNS